MSFVGSEGGGPDGDRHCCWSGAANGVIRWVSILMT